MNKSNSDNTRTTQTNAYFEQPASNGTSIEQTVMKRVRRIHTVRRFMNKTAYKLYGATALVLLLSTTVSVGNVYANMPSLLQPTSLFHFFLQAVLNTELMVQITLLVLTAIVVLFIRDLTEKGTTERKSIFAQS